MTGATHFAHPLAVEAWDAWFRWRTPDGLRDRTIDDTWTRVANAVATAEQAEAPEWSLRFGQALRRWQMLPDEGTLARAGTGDSSTSGARATIINAAAFVIEARGAPARLDREGLIDVARLAARFLCDSIRLDTDRGGRGEGAHIGMLGVADALAALGLSYDSEAARTQAGSIAAAIHEGCWRGISDYRAQKGIDAIPLFAGILEPSVIRAEPSEWRHNQRPYSRAGRITALMPHPRLALLANHRGDMVDAALGTDELRHSSALSGLLASSAGAKALYGAGTRLQAREPGRNDPAARVLMRAAVQPWIDAPIETPFVVQHLPNPDLRARCDELARQHGLPTPRWVVEVAGQGSSL